MFNLPRKDDHAGIRCPSFDQKRHRFMNKMRGIACVNAVIDDTSLIRLIQVLGRFLSEILPSINPLRLHLDLVNFQIA